MFNYALTSSQIEKQIKANQSLNAKDILAVFTHFNQQFKLINQKSYSNLQLNAFLIFTGKPFNSNFNRLLVINQTEL